MFTGIIKALAPVRIVKKNSSEMILSISLPKDWKVVKGNSIAVNGVCLTVANINKKNAEFFCQKETLDVTCLKLLNNNDIVNLERAMTMADEFGGHMVQGHVDTTSICEKIEKIGEGWRYWIKLPKNSLKGIVLKGSIALDGISLTISRLNKKSLAVDIIPFTHEHTNIKFWKKGTCINIETDIIGKYIESYIKKRSGNMKETNILNWGT